LRFKPFVSCGLGEFDWWVDRSLFRGLGYNLFVCVLYKMAAENLGDVFLSFAVWNPQIAFQ
jgi:hypothetical protein